MQPHSARGQCQLAAVQLHKLGIDTVGDRPAGLEGRRGRAGHGGGAPAERLRPAPALAAAVGREARAERLPRRGLGGRAPRAPDGHERAGACQLDHGVLEPVAETVILFGSARRTANKSEKVSLFYKHGQPISGLDGVSEATPICCHDLPLSRLLAMTSELQCPPGSACLPVALSREQLERRPSVTKDGE